MTFFIALFTIVACVFCSLSVNGTNLPLGKTVNGVAICTKMVKQLNQCSAGKDPQRKPI